MGKRKRSGSFSKYDECSKKSDEGESQEEAEGDSVVVHKGNANGIRYSARVQEKQEKLRRESSPSKQLVGDSSSTSTITPLCQSAPRVAHIGEEAPDVYSLERPYLSQSVNPGEKKKKRTWELWSQEDKQLFFEALNEFGKDFDAIQNYLASKLKPRKGGSCSQLCPKNKDQVRHFYYRTWNKISKYLTFPKDMKKAYQELYGLINYGELRKKQRVLNLKTAVKLSELVLKGTSTIKVRGKTFRIKTPVCRALKKLNQLEEIDHIRVPCKLCIELIPHDGETWTSVQRVSHNPRVKVYVPLQRTLASLILYFEERWKTDQNRLKEEFSLTVFGKPRTRLRFFPVESRDLSVPIFKFSEVTSATKISLSSYVQNCLKQERQQESTLVSKKFKRKTKSESESTNVAHRDADYLAAEADVSDVDNCEALPENQFRITLRRDRIQSGNNNNPPIGPKPVDLSLDLENSNGFPDNNALWSVHEENANAAAETDAGETDYGFDENVPSPTECDENTGDEECLEQGVADNQIFDGYQDNEVKEEKPNVCSTCKGKDSEDNAVVSDKGEKACTCNGKGPSEPESIRLDTEITAKGWNADEAGAITVGQIYLMLGKSDKLCFEYTWDKCEEDKLKEERTRGLIEKLVSIARQLKKKRTNRAKTGTNAAAQPCNAAAVCAKCKIESPGSLDNNELPVNSASILVLKDGSGEVNQSETPCRAAAIHQQQKEISAENKKTIRVVSDSATSEYCLRSDIVSKEFGEGQEVKKGLKPEVEVKKPSQKDESTSTQGLITANSITTPIPDNNVSSLCSSQQSLVAPQTGLIELTSLTKSDIEGKFRRVAPNIKATIIPTSTAILRSVALTNTAVTDTINSTLGGCHGANLNPVATTATVLVSEPTMFAGIATDATPFVTIQQCSSSVTASASSSSTKNTQDNKFRRPADVPILMKPSSDDRSTNEDGSAKLNVPKPFLDLPKGNRRIGRRPAWKQRVIIPRMLPLLPKPDATMTTTLIAIPPVVATGLSMVPVTAENLSTVTALPITSDVDAATTSAALASSTVSLAPNVTVTVTSILPSFSVAPSIVTSALMPGATSFSKVTGTSALKPCTVTTEKPSPPKSTIGFDGELDSLSLSSFMDISIPESTRFVANELRFDDLECSNSSVTINGMLDETSRKNTRDPPLLDTPKKRSDSDEPSLDPDTPEKLMLSSYETWNEMNEGLDFSMGSLFNGNEVLRPNSTEPRDGDLTFQSVIGDGSLDFESKLSEFSSLTDRNKD